MRQRHPGEPGDDERRRQAVRCATGRLEVAEVESYADSEREGADDLLSRIERRRSVSYPSAVTVARLITLNKSTSTATGD
jgi:hypothetical protein